MKAQNMFDTLAYANRLKAAGVETQIAEAQAEVNADMIANLIDSTLATKQDITNLRIELKQEIADVRHEIRDVRVELADLRGDLKETRSSLELKIAQLENRLILRLGGIMVTTVSVAVALLTIMHVVH